MDLVGNLSVDTPRDRSIAMTKRLHNEIEWCVGRGKIGIGISKHDRKQCDSSSDYYGELAGVLSSALSGILTGALPSLLPSAFVLCIGWCISWRIH